MAASRAVGFLTLREVRRFIAFSHARMAVAFFALVYALGAMLWGGMLVLTPTRLPYSILIFTGNDLGQQAWNYPGLLITTPWAVVTLPFFTTLTMVVSAYAVGLGMTVAFLLVVRLVRPVAASGRQSAAMGSLTGLTPAMISLVTLGACCSTTGVATAGIGLIATASGTSVATLLVNNWYLGVFQVAIVWVALVAQELLLLVYGGLFGLEPTAGSARAPPRYDRKFAVGAALRAALFVGGLLWCLTALSDWTTISPVGAGAGLWFRWLFQHFLLGGVAMAAALFPLETRAVFARAAARSARWTRVAVLLAASLASLAGCVLLLDVSPWLAGAAAISAAAGLGYAVYRWIPEAPLVLAGYVAVSAVVTLTWVPSAWAAAGVETLGAQLLGLAGAPVGWGAASVSLYDPGVYVRLVLGYALLGAFALVSALAPTRSFEPLSWSVGRPVSDGGPIDAERSARLSPNPVRVQDRSDGPA